MASDGIGLAGKTLGLNGVRVLDVDEQPTEVVSSVKSTHTKAWCPSCRRRAEAQEDRLEARFRDARCFGSLSVRPLESSLAVLQSRVRAKDLGRTDLRRRRNLTFRTEAEVTRQVGEVNRTVSQVAVEYGCWDTCWSAITKRGRPPAALVGSVLGEHHAETLDPWFSSGRACLAQPPGRGFAAGVLLVSGHGLLKTDDHVAGGHMGAFATRKGRS